MEKDLADDLRRAGYRSRVAIRDRAIEGCGVGRFACWDAELALPDHGLPTGVMTSSCALARLRRAMSS